jgi:hypothetical protein
MLSLRRTPVPRLLDQRGKIWIGSKLLKESTGELGGLGGREVRLQRIFIKRSQWLQLRY